MPQLGALFTDRDFERVDNEIEEALRGYDGHRRSNADSSQSRAAETIRPSRTPVDLDVPAFLLRRDTPSPTASRDVSSREASILHLSWLIPLAAVGIGYLLNDRFSAVGYFLAPAAVWLVVAVISGMLEDSGLSQVRNGAAMMQYASTLFVGTIAVETWSFGMVELVAASASTVVLIAQILISAFLGDDDEDDLPTARPGKQRHRDRFKTDLPPIRTSNDGMGLRIL